MRDNIVILGLLILGAVICYVEGYRMGRRREQQELWRMACTMLEDLRREDAGALAKFMGKMMRGEHRNH